MRSKNHVRAFSKGKKSVINRIWKPLRQAMIAESKEEVMNVLNDLGKIKKKMMKNR